MSVGKPVSNEDDTKVGVKYDSGKLRYDLVPPVSLEETVKVLTVGAQKYSPENWRYVDSALERYFGALQRHAWAWKQGQETDPETGLHHMAHAACCALFICELELLKGMLNENLS